MENRPWLTRPENVRLLWRGFIAVLAITVVLQLAIPIHGHFGIDGTFGFFAWYGFIACAVMILGSKLVGVFLKRKDTYYDE